MAISPEIVKSDWWVQKQTKLEIIGTNTVKLLSEMWKVMDNRWRWKEEINQSINQMTSTEEGKGDGDSEKMI